MQNPSGVRDFDLKETGGFFGLHFLTRVESAKATNQRLDPDHDAKQNICFIIFIEIEPNQTIQGVQNIQS